MEASQMLIQSEAVMTQTRSYMESSTINSSQVTVKKAQSRKKSMKKNKDENNISVKSGSKKLSKKISNAADSVDVNPNCTACTKPVYAMERIKAERKIWHKECFRCRECNKQLTVETYQSNHTTLYCKQHFKNLFAPKAVEDDEETNKTQKRHQLIICESNPKELPPDVVRASDKPDLGLEELSSLNVKSRFEMFENPTRDEQPHQLQHHVPRDKSSTLLAKLAKFKAKGMDVGVADECLNGIPIEPSSSEGEEDEDSVLKRSYAATAGREQPVSFCNMSEIVGRFETGQHDDASRRAERKQEIQSIRSRLFMGKQAKIKEMYEQSVMQSEQGVTSAEKIALELDQEKARSIKEKFENGEIFTDGDKKESRKQIEDETVFNDGIGKKSRSIFLELDANAQNAGPLSPPAKVHEPRRKEKPFIPKDVVRAADKVDDVHIETNDISNKFQFFETYRPKEERRQFRMTPPRDAPKRASPEPEVYRDPEVVRAEDVDPSAETTVAQQRHTASRMINVFKQMEQDVATREQQRSGPKPLKSFTPPLPGADYRARSSSEEMEEEEYSEEDEDGEEEDSEDERLRVYNTNKHDEALLQAQTLARAKNMRERFEHWSESEQQQQQTRTQHSGEKHIYIEKQVLENGQEDNESQIETAKSCVGCNGNIIPCEGFKSLRDKFENMKMSTANVVKNFGPKVNRFV